MLTRRHIIRVYYVVAPKLKSGTVAMHDPSWFARRGIFRSLSSSFGWKISRTNTHTLEYAYKHTHARAIFSVHLTPSRCPRFLEKFRGVDFVFCHFSVQLFVVVPSTRRWLATKHWNITSSAENRLNKYFFLIEND